jgi:hypothetical protein
VGHGPWNQKEGTEVMMKNIVRKIGTYKKSFKDSIGKEKKEGRDEIKEQTLVIEDPAQVLEEENQQEESSEEVINIDSAEITQALDFLYTSLKKLLGSNKQLSSVGKHLAKQIPDTALEKQLIAGYLFFSLFILTNCTLTTIFSFLFFKLNITLLAINNIYIIIWPPYDYGPFNKTPHQHHQYYT